MFNITCTLCRIMLGLMAPTWFLSMWISNTATTAMMIPIANAILLQLKDSEKKFKGRTRLFLDIYMFKLIIIILNKKNVETCLNNSYIILDISNNYLKYHKTTYAKHGFKGQ